MVSFARARTRSWLSRLWNDKFQTMKNEIAKSDKYNELLKKHQEQKQSFLEQSKNGGIWFS